jgi:hypothetical protein
MYQSQMIFRFNDRHGHKQITHKKVINMKF